MKVLTAAQMRDVDKRTAELGIPNIILMENAGQRVVEFLEREYAPLAKQRIVVVCGKGNNGGDGLVVARQLFTRVKPPWLRVVLACDPSEMRGDALENFKMLKAVGCSVWPKITEEMRTATLVVDAVLGTGLSGPARGQAAESIQAINDRFPLAEVVAVDVPSGIASDLGDVHGEVVRAKHTVTFTAPKPCLVLAPACELAGKVHVAPIGTPPKMYEGDPGILLSLSQPAEFSAMFQPRVSDSNKGLYGHVLVIAGGRGKTGAAAMAGIAALRAGAGLSTVASAASAISAIASYAPEIMTEPLAETDAGSIAMRAPDDPALKAITDKKTVIAIGPGMGQHPETVQFIRRFVQESKTPMVVDADALNALAGQRSRFEGPRIFTPHPGEMSRLTGKTVAEVQADRIGNARAFATEHGVYLVLKGNRSLIAFPDGPVWINPTGSPSMATGGTGDVLTGMIAGLVAQFPNQLENALLAAVYLHGRAGELGADAIGEKSFMATDLFEFLPEAMREIADLSHPI
ncbi:MAG TPA: NAD(P)H-hydrate dehydratase [Bryobacteraceae bacterium]|nr:NAD(P)H-hydrate dehydratase [Bryobacteraceae bacterium]